MPCTCLMCYPAKSQLAQLECLSRIGWRTWLEPHSPSTKAEQTGLCSCRRRSTERFFYSIVSAWTESKLPRACSWRFFVLWLATTLLLASLPGKIGVSRLNELLLSICLNCNLLITSRGATSEVGRKQEQILFCDFWKEPEALIKRVATFNTLLISRAAERSIGVLTLMVLIVSS